MSETTRIAEIRITVNADGAEAGLRPAIDAARQAERALSGVGAGSNESARAQRNLIQAIQQSTAQMEAGSRSSAQYYETLARHRGVDGQALEPYLNQLRAIESAQGRAGASAADVGNVIKGALGAAFGDLSLAGFLKQVVSAQRELDQLGAQLTGAVGSSKGAGEAFKALQKFAAATPYSVREATEAFVKLQREGLDPSEQALRSYGNMAAGLGVSLDQMVGAVAGAAGGDFDALGQLGITAAANGDKVTMTFRGVATTIGNSASEIESYLQTLGETDFASAMALRTATLDGAIGNLGDTWSATLQAISGSGIGDVVQEGALGVSAALTDLQTMLGAVTDAADEQGRSLGLVNVIHQGLTTAFEAVTVLGVNVAYVFRTIGKEIGGTAAQVAAVLQGEFAQARTIGQLMKADAERDRKEVDAKSAAILGAVEKARKAAQLAPGAAATDVLAQFRAPPESTGVRPAAPRRREQPKRDSEALAGDVGTLSKRYAQEMQAIEGLSGARAGLLKQQPALQEAAAQEAAARKAQDEFNRQYAQGLEATGAVYAKSIKDAEEEAARNEEIARTFGLTKLAIEELEIARLEEQLAQRSSIGMTLDQIEYLEQLIGAKKRNAAAIGKVEQLESGKKALDELNQFLDPAKAQTFGDALKGAFGSAGEALSKLLQSYDGLAKGQAEIAKHRATAEKERGAGNLTEVQYLEKISALQRKETKDRMSGYGSMASAAAGFFGEQSRGYDALMAVSKVFHAAELAMTVAELVPKGISAVLSQGSGDPYSAFGRMAAMAAIVAGLGVAIGGVAGGGPSLSESRQKSQGTGSVLGSDAKSESISRSLDNIESATLQGLGLSNGMLTSLRNIEAGIVQFASLLVRTTGVTGDFGGDFASRGSADAFGRSDLGLSMAVFPVLGPLLDKITGGWLGKITGSVLGSIFGGKTTVEDTGFVLAKATFGKILAGGTDAAQYADIKKDGGWFSSDKRSTRLESLGAEGNRQIAGILTSLYDTVFEAGTMIGLGADAFSAQLNSFVVDIGKVSFKGMSNEDIQKELEAVFSKLGDDLARYGVGGLEQFQKVGEGYFETLTRVATNYQAVTAVTQSMGIAFDAVGVASVGARERLVDLAGGIDEFTSSADQFLADFYTDQERADALRARIAPTLEQFGIASGNEDSLKQFRNVVTGLDLTTEAGARAYATLMQIAPAFKQIADIDAARLEERAGLQDELDQITLSPQQLRDKERMKVDESNRSLFDEVRILTERKGLQEQLDQMTMSSTEQLAKQREALDESNRALFDQVQAIKAKTVAEQQAKALADTLMGNVDSAFSTLQGVVNREKSLLQERINVEQKLVDKHRALSDALRGALDGMTLPGRELDDRQDAQARIQAALAIARSGGVLPEADSLRSALSVLGRDSAALFSNEQDYLRDFYVTRLGIEDLADLTDETLSVEMQSLKLLEDQVKLYDEMLKREQEQIDVLKGISTTGLSIEQALQALHGALASAGANPAISATSRINDAYQSALGRTPDTAGLEYWKNLAAGGTSTDTIVDGIKNSAEARIQKLYKEVFGRPADAGGLNYWIDRLNAGVSLDTIRQAFAESDEAKNKLSSLAVGTNHVPADMPVMIHEGERVIPAADNRELMRRLSSPDSDSALAVAVERLTEAVERQARTTGALEAAFDQTQRNTRRMADGLEVVTDGFNAIRTKQEVTT
ncbi:DUF4214 domain-containing protein [Massilia aurea]|uniref:DUF4214 domain-containing protein n=1 Tax=Massilia aurea TaxID=373040 RepID=UPI000F2DE5C0|nr:DUF4214 domain-containing protein [Massilia aurea]